MSAFSTSLENMLDIQFIREHADVVKESQRKRGESVELVDEVLRSDEVRRSSLKEFEAARAQQKEIGKKVAAAQADEKAKLIAETKELSQKVSEYKAAADAAAEEYTTAMWKLSNVVEPEAPEGGEDDYVVVKKVGQIRDFAAEGFEPKDHLTLGRGVAGIDMERGVKVGGSRFYFLRGQVARMQIAMLTMAVDQAQEHGFTLAITPTLVRPEVMRGTGFLNSHADEIYRLREPDEQYLVGTSEVALAGMHENEILDLSDGPCATAAGAPATAAKQVLLARILPASSACTSSTRWRCLSTPSRRTPTRSMSTCWPWSRRCSARLRCRTASSIPLPAIWALLQHVSSIAKLGFRPRVATAS